jgi:hypothetical protein
MGPVTFGTNSFACAGNSGAAAASQALSIATRAVADQSLSRTLDAVRSRREAAAVTCPPGTINIDGVCRPAGAGRALGYAEENGYYAYAATPGRMLVKAPAAMMGGVEVHPAIWLQGFWDQENRDQSTATTTPTSPTGAIGTPIIPPGGLTTSTNLDQVTRTEGFLGGVDFTLSNFSGSDVFLVGMLAGYSTSHINYKNVTSVTDLAGPSAGVFATYIHDAFSTDVTLKADFKNQDQQFSEFIGTPAAVSGTNSVRLNIYSIAGNVSYKVPVNDAWYFEPTAGTIYSDVVYGSGAAALGLADTTSTRLQAGARVGVNWKWSNVSVNSTLTGLGYSNVSITGGTNNAAAFASAAIPNDQGLLYGQFLFASNFDFGTGFSASLGTDVRFGNGVVGVGARGGFRYRW